MYVGDRLISDQWPYFRDPPHPERHCPPAILQSTHTHTHPIFQSTWIDNFEAFLKSLNKTKLWREKNPASIAYSMQPQFPMMIKQPCVSTALTWTLNSSMVPSEKSPHGGDSTIIIVTTYPSLLHYCTGTWCWYCSDGFPQNPVDPNPVHFTFARNIFCHISSFCTITIYIIT